MKSTTMLRQLLAGAQTVVAPGVFDGLSARLAARAGFPAVYATGGGIARSLGYPDLGLLGMSEVTERLVPIIESAAVPVIADADTGYGNALNVHRTVRAFERIGVAAFHLEDQTFPKRCGHLDDKAVVSTAEMVQKVRAARLPYPKLINMFQGGKTPLVPVPRLHELGYRIVIIPSDLQRAAIRAMEDALAAIRRDGHSGALADRMATFKDREEIVGTSSYLERDRRYAAEPANAPRSLPRR